MTTRTITHTGTLNVENCCKCGVAFAMPADMQRRLRNNGQWFYCPSGHSQHYTGPTEAQQANTRADRLASQLISERARSDRASAEAAHQRRRAAAYKGQMTKARRRFAHGVCPVEGCRRHFDNLGAHMASKHPDVVTQSGATPTPRSTP